MAFKKVLMEGNVSADDFTGSDGSANQVLKTDGSGTLSWTDQTDTNTNQLTTFNFKVNSGSEETISHGETLYFVEGGDTSLSRSGNTITISSSSSGGGVTISNNADNRVLTGDGTNANAEATLEFDGKTLELASASGSGDLNINGASGSPANIRLRSNAGSNNSTDEWKIQSDNSDNLNFLNANTNRVQIASDGTTDLKASKLKIGGSLGTDGQVLTSTGSGCAWENASGGGGGGAVYLPLAVAGSGGRGMVTIDNWDMSIGGMYGTPTSSSVYTTDSSSSKNGSLFYDMFENPNSGSYTSPYQMHHYSAFGRYSGPCFTAPFDCTVNEIFLNGSAMVYYKQNIVMGFMVANAGETYKPFTTATFEGIQSDIGVGAVILSGGNADSKTPNAYGKACKTASTFSGSGTATNTMNDNTTGVGLLSVPHNDFSHDGSTSTPCGMRFGLNGDDSYDGSTVLVANSSPHTNSYKHESYDTGNYDEYDGQYYFLKEASTWTDPQYHVPDNAHQQNFFHRTGDFTLKKGDNLYFFMCHYHDNSDYNASDAKIYMKGGTIKVTPS